MIRVVFAGTPEIAARHLQALLDAEGVKVVGVLTQPDRPAGRGMRLMPPPVKRLAQQHGLDLLQRASLAHDDAALAWLRAKEADFLVVVAFGLILPRAWLEAVRVAPVNVHASLLPRWRGAAPIERALLAGDAETGVCLMRMTEGLDEGPIYACRRTPIAPTDTGASLRERLTQLGCELLVEMLPRIATGKCVPHPQRGKPCYAAKLTSADRELSWQMDAAIVDRIVRCFAPKPGARIRFRGRWLKVLQGRVLDLRAEPGRIMAITREGVAVACASGGYLLQQVQPEGKRAMPADAFARGARLGVGERWPG